MFDPLPDGPGAGATLDPEMMEKLKDAYYEYRGWDVSSGIPTPEKLHEVDLDYLISQLWDK
jgi:aldehyde:ferredoxin oxidoreductase